MTLRCVVTPTPTQHLACRAQRARATNWLRPGSWGHICGLVPGVTFSFLHDGQYALDCDPIIRRPERIHRGGHREAVGAQRRSGMRSGHVRKSVASGGAPLPLARTGVLSAERWAGRPWHVVVNVNLSDSMPVRSVLVSILRRSHPGCGRSRLQLSELN